MMRVFNNNNNNELLVISQCLDTLKQYILFEDNFGIVEQIQDGLLDMIKNINYVFYIQTNMQKWIILKLKSWNIYKKQKFNS